MRAHVTRAAEGLDRRAFTVDGVMRMQEAGIISEKENFDLIEGELPMQAKTHVHELLKSAMNIAVVRSLPDRLWLGVETTMHLNSDTFVQPDLVVGSSTREIAGPSFIPGLLDGVGGASSNAGPKNR